MNEERADVEETRRVGALVVGAFAKGNRSPSLFPSGGRMRGHIVDNPGHA